MKKGSGRLVAVVAALVGAMVLSVLAATPEMADAQTDTRPRIQVFATSQDRSGPDFGVRATSFLPTGMRVTGSAECTQMYAPDGTAQVLAPAPSYSYPPVGTYYFWPNSCRPSGVDPVRIVDANGNDTNVGFVLQGGPWRVSKVPTETFALSVASTDPPMVQLIAGVLGRDATTVPNLTVTYGYEGKAQDGSRYWTTDECPSVTTQTYPSVATCTLQGERALEVLRGSGAFIARFDGTATFEPSVGGGMITAATGGGVDEAFAFWGRYLSGAADVEVYPVQIPDGCEVARPETTTSILAISIGQLDCVQLQVLQQLTGVAVGIIAGGGASFFSASASILSVAQINKAILQAAILAESLNLGFSTATLTYNVVSIAGRFALSVVLTGAGAAAGAGASQ